MDKLLPCAHCGSQDIGGSFQDNMYCYQCGASAPGITAWNTRHTPEGWAVVPGLDQHERQALQRFDETTRDDGTYDIDGYMIRTLARKGAVRHITAGRYEMTDAGLAMLAAAPKWGGE